MIWREPAEESDRIYPGLVVHDARVSGSITIGPTRIPLWAIAPGLVANQSILDEYDAAWTLRDAADFFYAITELRGEFGRLILELAAAERADMRGPGRLAWWQTKTRRARVLKQLKRCVACLEEAA